jgi:hypothetical protein
MSKSEPKIEKNKIIKKNKGGNLLTDKKKISLLIKRNSLTTVVRNRIIKQYAGGVCLICGDVPTKKITYDVDGAVLVERYCSKHFKSTRS